MDKTQLYSIGIPIGISICLVALTGIIGIVLNWKSTGWVRQDLHRSEDRFTKELVRAEERLMTAIAELRGDMKALHVELRDDIKILDAKVQTFTENVANHEGRIGGLERRRA